MRAIRMQSDDEGFLQPHVDLSSCVHCGLCETVCPVLHPGEAREPLAVYAAKAKDDDLRMKSSSGGLFSLFAHEIFNQGGFVYGAGWRRPEMCVVHQLARNEEELGALRGSKYVQSDMGDVYRQVKDNLEANRRVLFSGTPCQIAGLKGFLQKEYNNLFCMDFICNSVPSPLVFQMFCDKVNRMQGHPLVDIVFRDKKIGWHEYSLTFFSQFAAITLPVLTKTYYALWQTGVTIRRSCLSCPSRSFKSGADLTVGDAWGIERYAPELDDAAGTSVCFVNTPKGMTLCKSILNRGQYKNISIGDIVLSQPSIHGRGAPFELNFVRRENFFVGLLADETQLDRLAKRALHVPVFRRVLSLFFRAMNRGKRLFKKVLF